MQMEEKDLAANKGSRAVERTRPRFQLIPEFREKKHMDLYVG